MYQHHKQAVFEKCTQTKSLNRGHNVVIIVSRLKYFQQIIARKSGKSRSKSVNAKCIAKNINAQTEQKTNKQSQLARSVARQRYQKNYIKIRIDVAEQLNIVQQKSL